MKGLLRHTRAAAAAAAAAFVLLQPGAAPLAGAPGAPARYSIAALPGLPGATYSEAYGINNRGHIVGTSCEAECRAALWADGTVILLDAPGPFSDARDINNRGQIVGSSVTASGELHAMLWEDGVATDLGTLGGSFSSATAINDRGQIVGSSDTASGEQHAVLWEDGAIVDLGTLPGTGFIPGSIAWDINNRGQVVGVSSTASARPLWVAETHAFLWDGGLMIDLGRLPDGTFSSATSINERGDIAGLGDGAGFGSQFGLLWRSNALTMLSEGDGFARAINARGQVAGEGRVAAGQTRAMLWTNGRLVVLDTLPGGDGARAWDLNNAGQIVGQSFAGPTGTAVTWTRR